MILVLLRGLWGGVESPPAGSGLADFCSTEEFRQDFRAFRDLLEQDYPSLYRYNDSQTIRKLFDSAYAAINDRTSTLEFYRMLKACVSAIRDGHLYVGPSPAIRKYFSDTALLFPIHLRWMKDEAYALSSKDLAAGTEILQINHQPVSAIRQELLKYIAGDGNNETRKNHVLNNFFAIYYNMVYGNVRDFDVTVKMRTGHISTIKVSGVAARILDRTSRADVQEKPLSFALRKDKVALLTIRTFDSVVLRRAGVSYRQFLNESFQKMQRSAPKALIIDVRGNGGGRDLYGSLLYSYIAREPFRYYQSLTAATPNLPFEQFSRNVSSYNDLSRDLLDSLTPKRWSLRTEAHANLQLMQPAKKAYRGPVIILINGLSFSTTAEFCAVAKSNKRAVFVGEETGGAYEGSTSGVQIDTLLPCTKIPVTMGLIEYRMAVRRPEQQGRGIIPDNTRLPTVEELMAGGDVQLKAALRIADGKG